MKIQRIRLINTTSKTCKNKMLLNEKHKCAVAMKNGEIYYITKKEYDIFNSMQPYTLMDEIYDKFKEASGLKYIPVDKEIRMTNTEIIDTDDNSIQLKLTFELKDIGDE